MASAQIEDAISRILARLTKLERANTPTGAIQAYAGTDAPRGWLLANGAAVSRVDNADLFKVIGTTYGTGNGTTTFNLPDLRRRVPVGPQTSDQDFGTLGKTGGHRDIPRHSHQLASDPTAHSYAWGWGGNVNIQNAAAAGGAADGNRLFTMQGAWNRTTDTGNSDSTNNLPPYITVNYLIKN